MSFNIWKSEATQSTPNLNTIDYGIPQSRKRWYLVATLVVRSRGLVDWFPPPLGYVIPLSSIVRPLPASEWKMCPDNAVQKANMMLAYAKVCAQGVNPYVTPVVVDVGAGKFKGFRIDGNPCLTHSRASQFGCSTKGGHLDTREMSLLQGFNESDIDWIGSGVSACQFAACLGNTMSVNVLRLLLPRVLYNTKLISEEEHKELSRIALGDVRI